MFLIFVLLGYCLFVCLFACFLKRERERKSAEFSEWERSRNNLRRVTN